MAYVRIAVPDDARYLAENLRPADLVELEALGKQPLESLEAGLWKSQPACQAICTTDHEPVAMFGTVPMTSSAAAIWLLGSEKLTRGKTLREFLKGAPRYIRYFHRHYPLLANIIHVDNAVHHRWLRQLGFEFGAGPISNFLYFERRSHV